MDDAAQYLIDLAVFVCCETGWALDDVLDMPMSRLGLIAESISWRVRMKNYDEWSRTAVIASILMTAHGKKKVKPEKLIGKPPKRFPDKNKKDAAKIKQAIEKAKERGLNLNG